MYIRFVVGSDGEDHRHLTGVIVEARLLRDAGQLAEYEREWLQQLFAWFNENVPVPPYSKRRWPEDVAAWFKHDAPNDAIAKIWDIVALLREHGKIVRILRSSKPGYVHYEDDYQVVVSEI